MYKTMEDACKQCSNASEDLTTYYGPMAARGANHRRSVDLRGLSYRAAHLGHNRDIAVDEPVA